MRSLAACPNPWRNVLVSGGRVSSTVSDVFSSRPNPSTRLAGPGPSPGWKTKTHKRYTSKDRQLLQTLESTAGSGNTKACESQPASRALCDGLLILFVLVAEASFNLRRHFSSRSAALLVPLNRYLNTLIPRPSEASTDLRLKSFNNANFFASLKTHGAVLPFKSSAKQREFYERWLRSPAFGMWLARQEDLVSRTLESARSEKER
jgi:hypothetical protein